MKKCHQGFSLIEMLLAALLAGIVIAGVLASYLQVHKIFNNANALMHWEDSASLATQFFLQGVRFAGYFACLTNQENKIINHTNIVFQALEGKDNEIRTLFLDNSEKILSVSLDRKTVFVSGEGKYNPGDVVLLSDCQQGEIVQVDAVLDGGKSIVLASVLTKLYKTGAKLSKLVSSHFFVKKTGRYYKKTPVYALYRQNLDGSKHELVENVEQILVYYLVGSNLLPYFQVSDWSAVRSVEIHLLLSAPEMFGKVYDHYRFGGENFESANNIFRKETVITIALRERLL